MTIYSKINYRKIYESHFGPIPKDDFGRSYEIHHVDGKHSNNSPENLRALTIQEHYDIHYSQGDWAACNRIGGKMKIPSAELSRLNSLQNLKRVAEHTHPFLTRPDGTSVTSDKIKRGEHNLQKRPDGTSVSSDRVKAGYHNFLTRPDGTSHASDRVKAGTNPFQNPKSWKCEHCSKEGTGMGTYCRYHGDKCKLKTI